VAKGIRVEVEAEEHTSGEPSGKEEEWGERDDAGEEVEVLHPKP